IRERGVAESSISLLKLGNEAEDFMYRRAGDSITFMRTFNGQILPAFNLNPGQNQVVEVSRRAGTFAINESRSYRISQSEVGVIKVEPLGNWTPEAPLSITGNSLENGFNLTLNVNEGKSLNFFDPKFA